MKRLKYLHYLANLKEDEMLYKVFIVQWNNPDVGDWTIDVIKDMELFGVDNDLDKLKNISYNSFKIFINKKGKEIELARLLHIKNSKSKMKNLHYNELKLQNYLELRDISISQAISVYKFRVRMVPCYWNYKTRNMAEMSCPWCGTHVDIQENMFQCKYLRSLIEIDGVYDDLFTEKIPQNLAKTAHNICTYREEYRKYSN